jgi:PiT family inorganic phosphate transporter
MSLMLLLLALAVTLLAAANGANDNIKGAATLMGSGVLGFRAAITLATLATAAGGTASVFLAQGLLAAFGGKGIVSTEVATSAGFLFAVATGAAATVGLATRLGLPISTTHALLGGLVGAGLASAPTELAWLPAFKGLLLPLLLSPLLAISLALVLLPLIAFWSRRVPPVSACACAPQTIAQVGGAAVLNEAIPHFGTLTDATCAATPAAERVVVPASRALDALHVLSAAAVSFARGMNDTPKIAALLVGAGLLGAGSASLLVALAMAIGGVLASRRVAQTLAFRVTHMDAAQGLGGNLVTALLVVVASRLGLPVSTTHVSTGALFGIALRSHGGNADVIRSILLAWLLTLPVAAALAFLIFRLTP